MKTTKLSVTLCAFCGLVSAVEMQGQTWTNSNPPLAPYSAIACSADGRTILSAIQGYAIVLSTNGGQSWTQSTFNEFLECVTCSADGSKLFAGGTGALFISTNSGLTCVTNNTPAVTYTGVACSADGTKVAAVYSLGPVLYSTNSGITFTTNAVPGGGFTSIACSADGTKLIGTYSSQFTQSESFGGHFAVYRSVDSGVTWTSTGAPATDWIVLASSADGTTLAGVNDFGFAISKDSGVSWGTNAEPKLWDVACSADGQRLASVQGSERGQYEGMIFTSLDSGETWRTNDAPSVGWTGVAMSADGSVLVTSGNPGIYIAHIPAQPSLKITPAGSNLQLSWPLPSAGFVLQENSNFNSSGWVDVTNAVTQCGYFNQVTVSPPLSGNVYYRLVNQ
jgi:hypothetical protein